MASVKCRASSSKRPAEKAAFPFTFTSPAAKSSRYRHVGEEYTTMAEAVAETAMVVRDVVSELVSNEVHKLFHSAARYLCTCVSSTHTVVIDKTEGLCTN
ncbi:hypothetical protein ABZP36_014000 [Zizania latifolia]